MQEFLILDFKPGFYHVFTSLFPGCSFEYEQLPRDHDSCNIVQLLHSRNFGKYKVHDKNPV